MAIARAELPSDAEQQAMWNEVRRVIPQMHVYEKRAERRIRMFRLRRLDS